MRRLLGWMVLAALAYGLYRFLARPADAEDQRPPLGRARERLENALAEGRRVASLTRAELEAEAGHALRTVRRAGSHEDRDEDAGDAPDAPWPYASSPSPSAPV